MHLRGAYGPLTAAEGQVLALAACGWSTSEIARLLARSPHTVRTHLRNAGLKLETRGRFDAIARARQLGILDASP